MGADVWIGHIGVWSMGWLIGVVVAVVAVAAVVGSLLL